MFVTSPVSFREYQIMSNDVETSSLLLRRSRLHLAVSSGLARIAVVNAGLCCTSCAFLTTRYRKLVFNFSGILPALQHSKLLTSELVSHHINEPTCLLLTLCTTCSPCSWRSKQIVHRITLSPRGTCCARSRRWCTSE